MTRAGDLPLSFAQQRLWFLDRLQPGAQHVQHADGVAAAGPARGARRSTQSVAAVVARHESLRTRVVLRGGAPVQVIDPAPPEVLLVTDLSGAGAGGARGACACARRGARTPAVRSGEGPLFRAEVLRLAADEHVLLVNVHHIASDGWSVGVFHRELAAAYGAFVEGANRCCRPLPIQYADYAVWQRAWLQGAVLAAQRRVLAAPAGRSPSAGVAHGPAAPAGALATMVRTSPWMLPAPVTAALKALGRAGRRHAVHDAAGGLPGAAVALQRPDGHRGGVADCRARAAPSWRA